MDFFSGRENVGIVETDGGAVQEMRLIDRNVDIVELNGQQNFVDFGRADGPHVIDRVGLIGAIEILWRFIGAAVKRLVLPKGEIYATQAEALIFGKDSYQRLRCPSAGIAGACAEKNQFWFPLIGVVRLGTG